MASCGSMVYIIISIKPHIQFFKKDASLTNRPTDSITYKDGYRRLKSKAIKHVKTFSINVNIFLYPKSPACLSLDFWHCKWFEASVGPLILSEMRSAVRCSLS